MTQQLTPWKALRLASGLSLREVSRQTGIHPSRLSVLERGLTEVEEQKLRRTLSEAMLEKVS